MKKWGNSITFTIASLHFGSGGGHFFGGLALWRAFKRNCTDFHFVLLTDSDIDIPIEDPTLEIIRINIELEKLYSRDKQTMLYTILKQLEPDLIIVDQVWFPLQPIIQEFKSLKVIFFRFTPSGWFKTPPLPDGRPRQFQSDNYDMVYNIEPSFQLDGAIEIPPVLGVHPDEVKAPEIIREAFSIPYGKKLALLAHAGYRGEMEQILEKANLDPVQYEIVSLDVLDEKNVSLFPLSHYMGGVDLAIGGCGYGFFYETLFYGMKSIYIPQERGVGDQVWRYKKNRTYSGPFDGADKMISSILNHL